MIEWILQLQSADQQLISSREEGTIWKIVH